MLKELRKLYGLGVSGDVSTTTWHVYSVSALIGLFISHLHTHYILNLFFLFLLYGA